MLLILFSLLSLMTGILALGWVIFMIWFPTVLTEEAMSRIGLPLVFVLPLVSILTGVLAIWWVRLLGRPFSPFSLSGGQAYASAGVCLGCVTLLIVVLVLLALLAFPG